MISSCIIVISSPHSEIIRPVISVRNTVAVLRIRRALSKLLTEVTNIVHLHVPCHGHVIFLRFDASEPSISCRA